MDHCSAEDPQEHSGQAEHPSEATKCDTFDVNWSDIVSTDLELHRDNKKSLQYRELDHGDAGSRFQSDAVSYIILEVS